MTSMGKLCLFTISPRLSLLSTTRPDIAHKKAVVDNRLRPRAQFAVVVYDEKSHSVATPPGEM